LVKNEYVGNKFYDHALSSVLRIASEYLRNRLKFGNVGMIRTTLTNHNDINDES